MKFSYQARTKEGELRIGEIEASSKEAAALLLRKYELFPTVLKKSKVKPIFGKFKISKKISKKDLSAFSKQLGLMLSSQVSPVEALLIIASQTQNFDFREKILRMGGVVEKGSTFSEAFSLFPECFDNFYINLVKSGESTGKIPESLSRLGDHLESEYDIISRIKGALAYPVLILFVTAVVSIIVMFWVIPGLAEMLEVFKGQPSFFTRLVFNFFYFLKSWGWLLVLMFIGIVSFFLSYFRTEEGKKIFDKSSLKIPLFGDFFKKLYLSRFSESLSTLISAGLPITKALRITGEVIGNSVYKKVIAETEKEVSRGENISSVLIRYPELIPPFVSQMIRVGEKTGQLDKTLLEVVNFYQKEVKVMTETFMSILEPVLIIFVGIIVAILASSVFTAYYGAMKGLY